MDSPNKTTRILFNVLVGGGILAVLAIIAILLFTPTPVHSQVSSITKTWTAPGDDGGIGTATSYEMRYSSTKPDTTTIASFNAWWSAANLVPNMPAPLIAGTSQSVTITPGSGFLTGRTYYFVMRSTDDSGNVSPFSNVAWEFLPDMIPPRAIIDLR
jgi:hypothetical protein